jgi:hypothetical protein
MLRRALFLCMTKIREWLGENAFLCPTLQQTHSMCTPRTLLNDAKTLMVHPNSDTNYHMSNNLRIYLRIFLYHLDRREGHNWPKMTIDPNQMIFCNWATPFWPSIGVNKNHIKWYVQKKRGWKLNIDNITDRQVPGVLTLAGESTMGKIIAEQSTQLALRINNPGTILTSWGPSTLCRWLLLIFRDSSYQSKIQCLCSNQAIHPWMRVQRWNHWRRCSTTAEAFLIDKGIVLPARNCAQR